MTFIEAIKSGQPLTRKDKCFSYLNQASWYAMSNPTFVAPNTFIDPNFFLSQFRLSKEDVLANDWIIQEFTEKDYDWIEL